MTRTLTDEQINQGAKFYPHHQAADESDITSHPCIELGGDEHGDGAMQVYVYAKDGVLYVSLHYDTAGPTGDDGSGPWAYYGPDDAIPTVVKAGSETPVWQATAEANPGAETIAQAVFTAYQRGWRDRGIFRMENLTDAELAEVARHQIQEDLHESAQAYRADPDAGGNR
jgi:hypothetical protein